MAHMKYGNQPVTHIANTEPYQSRSANRHCNIHKKNHTDTPRTSIGHPVGYPGFIRQAKARMSEVISLQEQFNNTQVSTPAKFKHKQHTVPCWMRRIDILCRNIGTPTQACDAIYNAIKWP